MAPEGSKRVEIAVQGDKRQVTATLVAAFDGTFLPIQTLNQGKTDRCHPTKYTFPQNFDVFHSPNHWANEETCVRFFHNIIFPYIKVVREGTDSSSQKHWLLWIASVVKQLQLLWRCRKKVLLLSRYHLELLTDCNLLMSAQKKLQNIFKRKIQTLVC